MHLRIIMAIAKKDIIDAIKNAYILFALILPVGMSLLFGIMTPMENKDMLLNIVIHNPGQSQLIEQLKANPDVKLIYVDSADEVPKRVKEGAIGGLVLPGDFDANVAAGKTPQLQVYYNGRRGIGEQAALKQTIESALRLMAGQALPAKLTPFDVTSSEKAGEREDFNLKSFYLVLFLVMGLCMVGTFVVPTILVEEKEKHTLQAILVSPASYTDLVIGKTLVGVFYSFLVALTLLLLNDGFSGHAVVTILAVILGTLFLVMGGLLLGAVFSTTTQLNTWSSVVMLALLIPAIFIMPPQPPAPVSTVVHLIPTSYMADAINIGLSNKSNLGSAAPDIIALAVSIMIAFAAATWALRRERR